MAHELFISYSTKNKAVADAVVAHMETGGIRCWYAPRDIEAGADWAGSIIDAINSSKVMVLIFTEDSNISKQVLREVDCAVGAGVVVLPMRLTKEDPIESMKYYLSAVHWLDAVDADLNASIEELYKLVKAVLDSGMEKLIPTDNDSGKKKINKGAIIALTVLVIAAVASAVIFVPRFFGKKGDNTPYTPLKEEAPVGELSQNTEEPEQFIDSTSQSNLRAGGYVAYDDGWYYFRSNDEEKLYKMREDGSESMKLSDHSAKYIMIYDGYVYFTEEHGLVGIYRVSTDGEDEMQLYGSEVPFMGIIDDKLYFLDTVDGLCVMDLDEIDEYSWGGEPIYENAAVLDVLFEMNFDGENIYYTSFEEEGIFRVSIDGSEPEKIVDGLTTDMVLAGDYLYYNDVYGVALKAYNVHTGDTIKIAPFYIQYFHLCAEGIYGVRDEDNMLIRFDPSTGTVEELGDTQVTYLCMAGDKLYYWDFNKYYMSDLDGKNIIGL